MLTTTRLIVGGIVQRLQRHQPAARTRAVGVGDDVAGLVAVDRVAGSLPGRSAAHRGSLCGKAEELSITSTRSPPALPGSSERTPVAGPGACRANSAIIPTRPIEMLDVPALEHSCRYLPNSTLAADSTATRRPPRLHRRGSCARARTCIISRPIICRGRAPTTATR